MNKRREKVLWADPEFINRLEEMKAKRLLNKRPINSLGDLTREILKCPSFINIENEILNKDSDNINNLKIKMDKKRLFK